MNGILTSVIEAHGGLNRWKNFRRVRATIVTGGALFEMKGLPQDDVKRQMTVSLHEQWASVTPFGALDRKTAFTPQRIAIESIEGNVVAERINPRESFAGHQIDTPWDPLHRAYFNGYAMWTYLTTPFLLAMPEVAIQEVESWKEGEEEWYRLRARFPDPIATHSRIQDFFFDRTFRLRRHDYSVDVAGGFAAAQYVYDYTEADGLWLPTKRRAFLRGPDERALEDALMVSIDLSDIHFT
jgi:hypothetical protein